MKNEKMLKFLSKLGRRLEKIEPYTACNSCAWLGKEEACLVDGGYCVEGSEYFPSQKTITLLFGSATGDLFYKD